MQRNSSKFDTGEIAFVVWHEQWDANIHNHADQGVIILVEADVGGEATPLLRFNCFDVERSYVYAPEGKSRICRIDPIADGNPIGWTMRQLRDRLPQMLEAAGYGEIAARVDTGRVAGFWAISSARPATPSPTTGRRSSTTAAPTSSRPARSASGWRCEPCPTTTAGWRSTCSPTWRAPGRSLHGGDRDPGLRLLPRPSPLPLWTAEQEPPDLLGQDRGAGPPGVDP